MKHLDEEKFDVDVGAVVQDALKDAPLKRSLRRYLNPDRQAAIEDAQLILAELGENVEEEDLEAYVEKDLRRRLEFKPITNRGVRSVALAYIHRWTIGAVIAGAMIAGSIGNAYQNAQEERRLDAAERQIENSFIAYSQDFRIRWEDFQRELDRVERFDFTEAEQQGINDAVDEFTAAKARAEAATDLNLEGDIRAQITRENMESVEAQVDNLAGPVSDMSLPLNTIRNLTTRASNLERARTDLERAYNSFAALNPSAEMMEMAQTQYEAGLTELEQRNLQEAQTYISTINHSAGEIREIRGIGQRARQAFEEIQAIGEVNPRSMQTAQSLLGRTLGAVEQGNSPVASSAGNRLVELSAVLNACYEWNIVNRQFRVHDSQPRDTIWYAIVESTDCTGRRLPMEIENFETGRTERVTEFGVDVGKARYDWIADNFDRRTRTVDDPLLYVKRAGQEMGEKVKAFTERFITRW